MAIYWVFFDLPKNQGEMRLTVEAKTNEIATGIATKKAHRMSTEWVYRKIQCVR